MGSRCGKLAVHRFIWSGAVRASGSRGQCSAVPRSDSDYHSAPGLVNHPVIPDSTSVL